MAEHAVAFLSYFSKGKDIGFASYKPKLEDPWPLLFIPVHIPLLEHDYNFWLLAHPRNKRRLLCYATFSLWSKTEREAVLKKVHQGVVSHPTSPGQEESLSNANLNNRARVLSALKQQIPSNNSLQIMCPMKSQRIHSATDIYISKTHRMFSNIIFLYLN